MSFIIGKCSLITFLATLLVIIALSIPTIAPKDEVDYSFSNSVDDSESGVITHRWEKRKGDYVRGGYSFLDSDGKVRVVEYSVDGMKGFKAAVIFRRPPETNIAGPYDNCSSDTIKVQYYTQSLC